MRQMCQCNQCQKLNPVNQGVCQQCGENLILNGTMVNVDENGRIYPMEKVDSQPFQVQFEEFASQKVETPVSSVPPQPPVQPQAQPQPPVQPQITRPTPVPPSRPPRKKGAGLVKFFLIILLLAGICAGGYYVWDEYLDSPRSSGSGGDGKSYEDIVDSQKTEMLCSGTVSGFDTEIAMTFEDEALTYMEFMLEVDAGSSSTAREFITMFRNDKEAFLQEAGLPEEAMDLVSCQANGSKIVVIIEGSPDEMVDGNMFEADDIDLPKDELIAQVEGSGLNCH